MLAFFARRNLFSWKKRKSLKHDHTQNTMTSKQIIQANTQCLRFFFISSINPNVTNLRYVRTHCQRLKNNRNSRIWLECEGFYSINPFSSEENPLFSSHSPALICDIMVVFHVFLSQPVLVSVFLLRSSWQSVYVLNMMIERIACLTDVHNLCCTYWHRYWYW